MSYAGYVICSRWLWMIFFIQDWKSSRWAHNCSKACYCCSWCYCCCWLFCFSFFFYSFYWKHLHRMNELHRRFFFYSFLINEWMCRRRKKHPHPHTQNHSIRNKKVKSMHANIWMGEAEYWAYCRTCRTHTYIASPNKRIHTHICEI